MLPAGKGSLRKSVKHLSPIEVWDLIGMLERKENEGERELWREEWDQFFFAYNKLAPRGGMVSAKELREAMGVTTLKLSEIISSMREAGLNVRLYEWQRGDPIKLSDCIEIGGRKYSFIEVVGVRAGQSRDIL